MEQKTTKIMAKRKSIEFISEKTHFVYTPNYIDSKKHPVITIPFYPNLDINMITLTLSKKLDKILKVQKYKDINEFLSTDIFPNLGETDIHWLNRDTKDKTCPVTYSSQFPEYLYNGFSATHNLNHMRKEDQKMYYYISPVLIIDDIQIYPSEGGRYLKAIKKSGGHYYDITSLPTINQAEKDIIKTLDNDYIKSKYYQVAAMLNQYRKLYLGIDW